MLLSFLTKTGLGILCVVLFVSAFPPFSLPLGVWLAFVPFACLCFSKDRWVVLWIGICGVLFGLAAQDSLRTNMAGSDSSSWPMPSGGFAGLYLVLSELGGIQWILVALCVRHLVFRAGWRMAFALPAVWTSFELLATAIPPLFLGFSFSDVLHVGFTQTGNLPLLQVADLGGVYLISFMTVALNGACADAWYWRFHPSPRQTGPWLTLAFVAGMLTAGFAYGAYRLAESSPRTGPIVGLVQQEWASLRKDPEAVLQRTRTMEGLDDVKPDLLVFGENTLPFCRAVLAGQMKLTDEEAAWIGIDTERYPAKFLGFKELERLAATVDIAICCGATVRVSCGGVTPQKKLKTMAYIQPERGLTDVYHKINLSPHEITPTSYVQTLLGLGQFGYTAGRHNRRFRVEARSLGTWFEAAPGICYDGWLSRFFRQACVGDRPPDFFVLVSDLSEDSSGTYAQRCCRLAQLRAVESRRSVVTTVTAGISFVVDSSGRVLISGNEVRGGAALLKAMVPIDDRISLYAEYGDVFAWTVLGCTLIAIAWGGVKCRRHVA